MIKFFINADGTMVALGAVLAVLGFGGHGSLNPGANAQGAQGSNY